MIDPQRQSCYRRYWNDSPESMLEWDSSHSFPCVDWSTYSFAGRKCYDPITGNKLQDDTIIGRFIQFQHKMSEMSKSPIYPIIWVSSPPKALHFHCLEFSCGIRRSDRAKAFRNRFGKLTRLPKNLYSKTLRLFKSSSIQMWKGRKAYWTLNLSWINEARLSSWNKHVKGSVIKSTRTTDYHGCFHYGDKGHNQLITELITPKKHDGIPIELMGKLNPEIKGHQRMLDKHFPEALSFEKRLLALLK